MTTAYTGNDGSIPRRVQLRRTKGWRMPPNTVSVARPSVWGNPYKVGGIDGLTGEKIETAEQAVALFRKRVAYALRADIRAALRGKNLACYCDLNAACHADVLLEIAHR